MKTKTTEQYNSELKQRGFNLYCEKYISATSITHHYCTVGHNWINAPVRVLASAGCPQCLGRQTSTKWTEKEVDFLRENYYNKGSEWCSKELGRSLHGVRLKASRCKIGGQNHRLKPHDVYEEELLNMEAEAYPTSKNYVNALTPIEHTCIEDHTWLATPSDILKGSGCPICARFGFNPGKEAILYYVKLFFNDKYYYKIGVTTRTINARFKREDKNKIVKILLEKRYREGNEAKDEEQRILNIFDSDRAHLDILQSGNTEIFTWDVLQLDT